MIPVSELEAYNADDIVEMSDQMDLNFEGKVDNSLNYIVIESSVTDLTKGQVIPRHKANLYRGSGAILRRYDEYLKEQEAKNEPIEDLPDVNIQEPSYLANRDLVKYLASRFPWGQTDFSFYEDLINEAHEELKIPKVGSEKRCIA